MARRAIYEYDAKWLLAKYLPDYLPGFKYSGKIALIEPDVDWHKLVEQEPWLKTERLVAKPDQLFGKRGKQGLIGLDLNFDEAKAWIEKRMGKEHTIGDMTDKLTTFIIEAYVPHKPEDELFMAIRSDREADIIYFSREGGIEIEEHWDSVYQVAVPVLSDINAMPIAAQLPDFPQRDVISQFLVALYKFFVELDFTYLEINPFVIVGNEFVPLDFVAKVDDTASFNARQKWGYLPFPPAFGTHLTSEEEYVRGLDEKTGASLKLTVLNPDGRVWPLVAGGGASVIYADTVADLGFANELACYGEYSGNPNTEMTREYARTILDLMTRKPDPEGRAKYLLVGGGIANFTDVAKTFTGIIQALKEYKEKLQQNNVKIYVRRGGPNYKQGLSMMRELGDELGMPIEVYGPETHMTRIVSMALEGSQ